MKSNELLRFLLLLQQECGGVISFERFMQEALYHPLYGYYSAQIKDVGAAGDFSTSATLDSDLGVAIARWIIRKAAELSWQRIPVIEIGAGNGSLARKILRSLPWPIRLRIDYSIHETSPLLQQKQRKLLHWHRQPFPPRVRWISSLAKALDCTQGRALIFSNELVDAFPCKLFQKTILGWQEIGLSISADGGLKEELLGGIAFSVWFSQFEHLPEGQRVERLDAYREWLQGWSTHWREGSLLTIDYGDTAENLYHRRPGGSLRAYWRHQRLNGINLYARFGKQDLTTDVNFSDLIRWGAELGWHHSPLQSQKNFIENFLSSGEVRNALPGEAGDAFKVLEQSPA